MLNEDSLLILLASLMASCIISLMVLWVYRHIRLLKSKEMYYRKLTEKEQKNIIRQEKQENLDL